MKSLKGRGVTITEEQAEWLEKHPEINLSGLLRKTLDELMKKEAEEKKVKKEEEER
ncbi:MAG: hypothetical protein ACFE68_05150 [Candidatus Hodarchaeota archaeon]